MRACYELNLSLGKFSVEVNMTDIPDGTDVLRGIDWSSNFVSTDESPPPIRTTNLKE
jgi:hypothetical protein